MPSSNSEIQGSSHRERIRAVSVTTLKVLGPMKPKSRCNIWSCKFCVKVRTLSGHLWESQKKNVEEKVSENLERLCPEHPRLLFHPATIVAEALPPCSWLAWSGAVTIDDVKFPNTSFPCLNGLVVLNPEGFGWAPGNTGGGTQAAVFSLTGPQTISVCSLAWFIVLIIKASLWEGLYTKNFQTFKMYIMKYLWNMWGNQSEGPCYFELCCLGSHFTQVKKASTRRYNGADGLKVESATLFFWDFHYRQKMGLLY